MDIPDIEWPALNPLFTQFKFDFAESIAGNKEFYKALAVVLSQIHSVATLSVFVENQEKTVCLLANIERKNNNHIKSQKIQQKKGGAYSGSKKQVKNIHPKQNGGDERQEPSPKIVIDREIPKIMIMVKRNLFSRKQIKRPPVVVVVLCHIRSKIA